MFTSAPHTRKPADTDADEQLSSDRLDTLMRDLAALPPGPRRMVLRERAIQALLPLARRVARRFTGRGEDYDDLVQVAALGVVKAVDGYDHTLGHAFLAYALPTIRGEIRRHLRDRTTAVRLPRPLQEVQGQIFQAAEELEQRLGGRSPTPEQIARHTGLQPHRVLAALRAGRDCRPRSLDAPVSADDGSCLLSLLGGEDAALDLVVDTMALSAQLRLLSDRDRYVLYLRFYREQTQHEIAEAIGVSQMQVCRILRRCLARLREGLVVTDPPAREPPCGERGAPSRGARAPDGVSARTASRPRVVVPAAVAGVPGRRRGRAASRSPVVRPGAPGPALRAPAPPADRARPPPCRPSPRRPCRSPSQGVSSGAPRQARLGDPGGIRPRFEHRSRVDDQPRDRVHPQHR
ncbi:sigma-70 family RNA polymerase sigma factor [Streptomyces sediminimaris]|uniref:sigma-70 family RNA polymerase sigma factor n=1 Tax=Streptomyces sediminimaris TaxID=3383721 RepID=UPI0039997D64